MKKRPSGRFFVTSPILSRFCLRACGIVGGDHLSRGAALSPREDVLSCIVRRFFVSVQSWRIEIAAPHGLPFGIPVFRCPGIPLSRYSGFSCLTV